ncbi:MAG: LemA family protein [Candidatus Magnetomorum sp.]|nr:LemA family protein [Candidatus Magnetomorum sp.]
METSNISRIIKTAYGRRYGLGAKMYYANPGYRYYLANTASMIQSRWSAISIVLIVLLLIGMSVYYFNLLVTTEQDVLAAYGKVEALMQRRNDISINLSKAVYDYSTHERNVFTAVVMLRSLLSNQGSKPAIDSILNKMQQANPSMAVPPELMAQATNSPAAIPPEALSALSKLLAVAEQYPDLKLSTTFQSLMTALIEVEKDLATERFNFNDKVNIYTTQRASFPINAYAKLFGFKDKDYYESSQEAKSFNPISY